MIKQTYNSERLILRPMHVSDAPFILRLLNSPGWIEFIGDRKITDEQGAIKYIENIDGSSESFFWVAFDRLNQVPLGVVSLIQRTYLPFPDIGFAFLSEFGKQGFAFEAANCVLKKLCESPDYTTILATTMTTNVNSQRLLERLGLLYIQNIVVEHEELMLYSTNKEQTEIDVMIQAYYDFLKNKTADWKPFQEFFTPEATIAKMDSGILNDLSIADFLAPRIKLLTDGTLTDFSEVEVGQYTQIRDSIAHRFSSYRKNGLWGGKLYTGSGTKSFQLVKTTAGWKIHSLIWDEHASNSVTQA